MDEFDVLDAKLFHCQSGAGCGAVSGLVHMGEHDRAVLGGEDVGGNGRFVSSRPGVSVHREPRDFHRHTVREFHCNLVVMRRA